ncbi:MAG: hypothetical protein DCF17_04820 [Shackletoniella antarctica]|uniref:Uncharacterized protein n=1 Tax=Shackletoniella antarctica TaxID=268115 RepID=A0A2W4WGQ7_9CYAN|nr:MAG: hypothetical protein DCF17_04820 [Shackletoniella antarctica]
MPSLEQRQATDWEFVEVWTDATSRVPYVLVLVADREGCKIYDPKEDYRQVFAAPTYEEAKLWLAEDEYERVDGRLTDT